MQKKLRKRVDLVILCGICTKAMIRHYTGMVIVNKHDLRRICKENLISLLDLHILSSFST
jgi:hypothetical protein